MAALLLSTFPPTVGKSKCPQALSEMYCFMCCMASRNKFCGTPGQNSLHPTKPVRIGSLAWAPCGRQPFVIGAPSVSPDNQVATNTRAIGVCLGVTDASRNRQMSHMMIIRFLTGVGSNGLELRDLVRHSRRQGALLYRRQGK